MPDRKFSIILITLLLVHIVGVHTLAADDAHAEMPPTGQETFQLRFRPKLNSRYSSRMTTTEKVVDIVTDYKPSTQFQGNNLAAKDVFSQKITFDVDTRILQIDATGNVFARVLLRAIRADIDDSALRLSFDSTKLSHKNIARRKNEFLKSSPSRFWSVVLQGLIGQTLVVKFSPVGRIVSVQGVDQAIGHALAKADPNYFSTMGYQPMLLTMLWNFFGEDSNTRAFRAFFPQSPVTMGKSWTQNAYLSEWSPRVHNDISYTLESLEGNSGLLRVAGSIYLPTVKLPKLPERLNGFDASGQESGTITFDRVTGWTKSSSVELQTKVHRVLRGTVAGIPQSINITTDTLIVTEVQTLSG